MQEQPPPNAAITPSAFDAARQHFIRGISHYEATRYLRTLAASHGFTVARCWRSQSGKTSSKALTVCMCTL